MNNTGSLRRGAPAGPPAVRSDRRRQWWTWISRSVGLLFLAVVVVLMVRYARGVDWDEVWASVRALPARTLLIAAGLAALSHLLYSCFDLIGKRYTGHALPAWKVLPIASTSYAFNLNMGSAVGGVGMRLRLYSRLGLPYPDIAKIITLSMVTNWLGDMLLAGSFFTFAPLDLPDDWKMGADGLALLGLGLLATVVAYLVLCVFSRKRSWTIRGHELFLPPTRMALAQVALSSVNWMVIGAVIHTLLQGKVPYGTVLSVLLLAAMAGLIVRVPAGLGVLEAVFIALLSHRVPEGQLLGALLAYRAIYYIAPLAVAALVYLVLEFHAKRSRAS